MLPGMKLILRIGNVFPLFLAFLLIGSVWKLGWAQVAAWGGPNSLAAKFAGAALTQWP